MASVFSKHGRYYARWRDAAGRWRRAVTARRTKREAQRFAEDLERKAERQARGLEALPEDLPRLTFGELLEWWWTEYGSKRRGYDLGLLQKRLSPRLGKLALAAVSPSRLEATLQSHADELSPKSLNHLRAYLHRIFALAIQRGLCTGANPAKGVERRKVPRRIHETLRAEDVPSLLARLAPAWRPLFATAIWTDMRKGELFGLRKSDVDLEAGTITIRRSYDSDTTKGGHADVIPIADPLKPFLQEALVASRSAIRVSGCE